ncbi:hypothetical protein [Sphaerisporangium album]|uniref:hypothetical protein n=1 Tax=Sphaerisporangium album TaxID=509200 RepID=UPI0015F0D907|nr:hypothetical protein [Sphaerisporangium album]
MTRSGPPTTGTIVRYTGKHGLNAIRAAIVTADVRTLDPRGVEAGQVPALDSEWHLHLWVYTPSEALGGGFAEFNVPFGDEPGMWHWMPEEPAYKDWDNEPMSNRDV